jgi:tetratricopeptide (TPR) repeat protein
MRAGYDFESIVSFYKTVREQYGEVPPGDEKYHDHPRITERIAHLYDVRAQIERDFDRFNFGTRALMQGEYRSAIMHFRAFTSTFANSAVGWTNLGSAYLHDAIAQMPAIPIRYMVTYYRELEYLLRGSPEELLLAEEAYSRAAALDTSYNIVYHGNMSIIAALNEQHDEAVNHAQQALEGEEAEHIFYNSLGNAFFMKKEYKEAQKAYKAALEHAVDWSLPRYNLAILYEKTGDTENAVDQWNYLLGIPAFAQEASRHLIELGVQSGEGDHQAFTEPEQSLGDLEIGMDEEAIITKLGEPEQRTLIESMVALEYPEQSIVIILRNGAVTGIICLPGFEGATEKGIQIGSTIDELKTAYGLPEDIVNQTGCDQWVYYKTGLLFSVSNTKVTEFQIVKART